MVPGWVVATTVVLDMLCKIKLNRVHTKAKTTNWNSSASQRRVEMSVSDAID